jgi:AcrR family transcriptional regulator
MNDAEAVRAKILIHALEIFEAYGYDGFSMRKLALPLGIASKTLYNYFHNKDEIYLHILVKGFEQLSRAFEAAIKNIHDPFARLAAAIRTYIDFGLENDNLYNLMFTWHVPKFKDYVGTSMERLAPRELRAALSCDDLFRALIRACVRSAPPIDESKIRFEMIQIWSQMHGYLANINNTSLSYICEDPVSLKEAVVNRIAENAFRNLEILTCPSCTPGSTQDEQPLHSICEDQSTPASLFT